MNVLGFDLGAKGAAVYIYGENRETKTWTWDMKGDRVLRASLFHNLLISILAGSQPDLVFYERPFARGQDATRSLWGLAGILEAVAGDVAAVTDDLPSVIKKWATGKGKATKEDMIETAELLGYTAETEHAADAFLAALYALENMEVST